MHENPPLNDPIRQLEAYLSTKSVNTIRSYTSSSRRYLSWLAESSLPFLSRAPPREEAKKIQAYMARLRETLLAGRKGTPDEKKLPLSTLYVTSCALLALYKANGSDMTKDDLPDREAPDSKPLCPTSAQVGRLLQEARFDTELSGVENTYPLLTLIHRAGLRVSEATYLRFLDLRRRDSGGWTVTVRDSKGQKGRTVPVIDSGGGEVSEVMARLAARGASDPGAFVFRVSPIWIERKVAALVSRIRGGLVGGDPAYPDWITPHSLRHAIATRLLKEDKWDVKLLQEFLGHESIATTQVYTHVSGEDLSERAFGESTG